MKSETYRAPWGRALIVTSVAATFLCVGVAFGLEGFLAGRGFNARPFLLLLLIPPASALFIVRGYRIASEEILVLRPGWVTRLPRKDLRSADFEPDAMRGSFRLCGNGGLGSFTGLFWSRRLRRYRAFVTDLKGTVVLRYPRRTVVLSPERPREFVETLSKRS